MRESETVPTSRKAALRSVVALVVAVVTWVVGSLNGIAWFLSLAVAAFLALIVWLLWPRIEERVGGMTGFAWTLVGILAVTNFSTLRALKGYQAELHDQRITLDTLKSQLELARDDNRELRDEVRRLNERAGERAQRDMDEKARLSVVADATRLEHAGQALLRRCCMEAGYAAVVPHALDSTITVWRRSVRTFVRRTSNPAFELVSYADQTQPPEPRTRCDAVMFGPVNRPLWEIEQDLKELAAIRSGSTK